MRAENIRPARMPIARAMLHAMRQKRTCVPHASACHPVVAEVTRRSVHTRNVRITFQYISASPRLIYVHPSGRDIPKRQDAINEIMNSVISLLFFLLKIYAIAQNSACEKKCKRNKKKTVVTVFHVHHLRHLFGGDTLCR